MIEYVFFHLQTMREFLDFLRRQGVVFEERRFDDRTEISVPEDLDEAMSECVDDYYDEILAREADLTDAEQGSGPDNYERAGITLNLRDGGTVYADIDSQLLARVMSVITPQEFTLLVDAIVGAVENREESSYCQRLREQGEETDV